MYEVKHIGNTITVTDTEMGVGLRFSKKDNRDGYTEKPVLKDLTLLSSIKGQEMVKKIVFYIRDYVEKNRILEKENPSTAI